MTSKQKAIIQGIIEEAFVAAQRATAEYLRKYPDERYWYPCGFAWVRIEGRSPVVTVLKESFDEQQAGHKAYPKGWDIWNPSGHPTQSMDAKMAGARAFADRLNAAGYKCYADCRMD